MRTAMLRVPVVVAAFAAAFIARPGSAHAQGAAAEALFDSGRAAMEKGDFTQACEQFRESNRLDPAVGTEFNLADCEENRGRLATAWQLFRSVEEKLPPGDERVAIAHARATALKTRVPTLTLTLSPGAPKNSAVRDGDVELGSASFGIALPVEPGPHAFVVSAPGHSPRTFQLRFVEGDKRSLAVGPGSSLAEGAASAPADASAAPRDHEEPTSGGSNTRTLGFALGGVGVLGLGVGAVAGFLVLGKKHAVDDGCGPNKSCTPAGLDAVEAGRTLQTVSNVGWVVGAVGLGAGAYFVLTSSAGDKPSTTVGLLPRPSGGELSVSRSW